MDQMNKDMKIFEFEGKKYKVVKPNNKIKRASEAVYMQAFREAVANKFFLDIEIDELLESRGLDDKSVLKKRTEVLKQIRNIEVALAKGQFKNKEEGKALAFKAQDLRNGLERIDAARQELKAESASTKAENRRFNFYAFQCVTTEGGEPLWNSFDEYENDESPLAWRASSELLGLIWDTAQVSMTKVVSERPENKWLKDNKFVDDEMNLIDTKGHLIDRDGRLINKEGYFINEEGNRIDIFGNRLDDDGNIAVDDISSSKKKKKSQTAEETEVVAG